MAPNAGNEEWAKLSPLLDRVLELEPAEREPWLVELASAHPELADELRELLANKAQLESIRFLEDSRPEVLGQATLAGQRIGAYEIERLIGHGGMGSVWLAHRCDGRYEGKVAVKLLNAALVGSPAEQRFVREGNVLAALRHPNIAHLIDAGVWAGGQPYLILEHVEGASIDEFCRKNHLGIRARLRVFLNVLEAVAHAHRHLVVHRDLKPSNILVTPDGVVKLLDFGIATLLDPGSDAQADLQCTREIGAALTPEYAAPEQLLGQTVTTATDIYALGRVLYVVLTDQRAQVAQAGSAADLVRDTIDREPLLLSDRAANAHVKRLLRGDLDNIAAKALKGKPTERYATVDAFAEDLRHYLANEPVSARPDSFGYRVGKFVGRHRGGVLTGALTVMALLLVTVFALLQMLEAQHQRDEAQAQRQRAEGFSTTMTSLLSQVGPGGRALRPDELLERAVEQVEATYADDPRFLVHMLILISGRYFDLRNTNLEHATLVKAESVARQSGDPLLLFNVQCNTVETELAAGRHAAAQQRLDEALSLLPVIPGVPPLDHAACLRARSDLARANGDLYRALEHMEEARRVLEKHGRTTGNVYAGILSGLAAFNSQAGKPLTAHAYFLKLVELDSRLGRQNSMPGVLSRISLAGSYYRLGQVQKAESMYRSAAADGTPTGADKVLYAEMLARLGRNDAAIELIREALVEVDERGHQEFRIRARLALAQTFFRASSLAEAEQSLEDATRLMQRDEEKFRHFLVVAHRLRAEILLAEGRLSESAEEISLALQRHRAGGDVGPRKADIMLTQALVRLAQGEPAHAAESARAAAKLFEENTVDAEQSADVGEALLVLAQAEAALGDVSAARRSLGRAGRALRNGLGADHSLTVLSDRLTAELR